VFWAVGDVQLIPRGIYVRTCSFLAENAFWAVGDVQLIPCGIYVRTCSFLAENAAVGAKHELGR
jgi:hypothetical protein